MGTGRPPVVTRGTGVGGSSSGSCREDRRLQPSQLRSGLDAQLLTQDRSRGLEGAERVSLAPRPVQSQHLLPAETLPQRILRDQGVHLRRDQSVQSEGKLGLEPQLQAARLELLQPHAVALREPLVGEVRQRRAPPQLERLAQHSRSSVHLAVGQEPSPLSNKTLETHRVDRVWTKPKRIANRSSDDQSIGGPRRLQGLAQLADQHLHRIRRIPDVAIPPQVLDDLTHRHHVPCPEREEDQQTLQLRPRTSIGSPPSPTTSRGPSIAELHRPEHKCRSPVVRPEHRPHPCDGAARP